MATKLAGVLRMNASLGSARVADAVAIEVGLVRIADVRTIVTTVLDAVAIAVGCDLGCCHARRDDDQRNNERKDFPRVGQSLHHHIPLAQKLAVTGAVRRSG